MANYPEMSKAAHRLLRELWNSQPTTLICVPVKDVAKGVRMKEDVVCDALGELAAEGILEGRIERGQAVYRVLVFPRRDTDS